MVKLHLCIIHATRSSYEKTKIMEASGFQLTDTKLLQQHIRLSSHWYKSESGYPSTGCSKHEFACIPIAAVHYTGSAYEYELPWNTSSFVYSSSFCHENGKKQTPQSCDINICDIIMVHVTLHSRNVILFAIAIPRRQTQTRTQTSTHIIVNVAWHNHTVAQ